jgi:hypothetical protein
MIRWDSLCDRRGPHRVWSAVQVRSQRRICMRFVPKDISVALEDLTPVPKRISSSTTLVMSSQKGISSHHETFELTFEGEYPISVPKFRADGALAVQNIPHTSLFGLLRYIPWATDAD